MAISNNTVILIRVYKGIGIDKQANGYTLTGVPVKRSCYNGRLCYNYNGKRVGYNTLKSQPPVKLVIANICPF